MSPHGRAFTDLADAERLLAHQDEVLELLSRTAPLREILDAILEALEELIPGAHCSVLLLDETGRQLHHGAAPSLSPAYLHAIDGLRVGPLAGSCGTAIHTRHQVVVADVLVDERWEDFRDAASAAGLRACWSTPIDGRDGRPVGTFAVYHREVHQPSARERRLVDRFTHLAAVAVEHDRLLTDRVEAGRAAEAERSARREAEVAAATAQQHSRAKSEFLTAASHEIRTPLQAITGFAELLGSLDLDRARRDEAIRRITRSVEHVLEIVEDVLDISRIEAGALPVEAVTVPVRAVVEEVAGLVAGEASVRGSVVVDACEEGVAVRGDRRRVVQVVLNLVTNALRHGRESGGTVTVTATRSDGTVVLEVADDGPGIPAEFAPRLFAPFQRWDHGSGRGDDVLGYGLGLVVSHGLASAMGGGLEMVAGQSDGQHRGEQGTRMRLTLPDAG